MAYVLGPQALANLATVKAELSLTVSTFDDPLTRLINSASDAIAKYCQRDFYLAQWTDQVGIPGTNRARIRSERFPVLLPPYAPNPIYLAQNDPGPGQALTYGTDFYLEEPGPGFFFRQARWQPTGLHRPDIAQDWDPDAIEAQDLLTYVAGFRTQPQIDAALAWPGAASPIALLQLVTPAAHATQVWQATVAGTTGGSEPSWPAAPAQGATITDNAVTWVYLGTQSQARTIPYDLEQACIETTCNFYRRRGQNLDVQIDKLGDAQLTYLKDGRMQLPTSVKEAINQFRRIWIG